MENRSAGTNRAFPRRWRTRRPGGFTLVELLTVIVILGILAGLITAAVTAAMKRARVAAIAMEIQNLSTALNAYKEKFGEYPPDFTDTTGADLLRHVNRIFPYYIPTYKAGGVTDLYNDIKANTNPVVDLTKADPSWALVFWLGGPQDANGRPMGFSANPYNPFDNKTGGSRIPPMFAFDSTRLGNSTNSLPYLYYPDTGIAVNAASAPYVYFRAKTAGADPTTSGNSIPGYDPNGTFGVAQIFTFTVPNVTPAEKVRPYFNAKSSTWCNAQDFQIISAGLDARFGLAWTVPVLFTPTTSLSAPAYIVPNGKEYDNITNFSKGKLEDMK